MINIKRPGTGLPPNFIYKIIGTKLLKNKTKDSIINLSDIRTKNKLWINVFYQQAYVEIKK